MPSHGQIFGFPADVAIRGGLSMLVLSLSTGSVLAVAAGNTKVAALLSVTGAILGTSLALSRMVGEEQGRRALEARLVQMEAGYAR